MKKFAYLLPRLVVSVILLQTLYFKFSAAPESVHIFTQLGLEPHGRVIIGIVELFLGILILIPKTSFLAAIGVLGVMAGAVLSHLFILGINVGGDGGSLFALALIVMASALVVVYQERHQLLVFTSKIFGLT